MWIAEIKWCFTAGSTSEEVVQLYEVCQQQSARGQVVAAPTRGVPTTTTAQFLSNFQDGRISVHDHVKRHAVVLLL